MDNHEAGYDDVVKRADLAYPRQPRPAGGEPDQQARAGRVHSPGNGSVSRGPVPGRRTAPGQRGPAGPGQAPTPGRYLSRSRIGIAVLLLVVSLGIALGAPMAPGSAVEDGFNARSPAAQVRIFENGIFMGGGTAVDRNWVLTAAHLFSRPDNPGAYSLRSGVINDAADPTGQTNLRQVDRIVLAPRGDVAMVHFVDPLPADTWIPRLATAAPDILDWSRLYGWGTAGNDSGKTLRVVSGLVQDPQATANAAAMRAQNPFFDAYFPSGVTPIVMNLDSTTGDSGSGVFSPRGVLSGVHWGRTDYRNVDQAGNLFGPTFRAAYELPIWQYRAWIQDTVNGAGPSGQPHDELKRRRLIETTSGDLPIVPPPTDVCHEDEASCTTPDPGWQPGVLVGYSHHQGTVLARCSDATDAPACTFGGATYTASATARLPLGSTGVTGTRMVEAWCTARTALNVGDPAQDVLLVSFTNTDHKAGSTGTGWWYVIPDHVTTDTKTPIDTGSLRPC